MSTPQPWEVALPGMPTPPDPTPHPRQSRDVVTNPDLLPAAEDITRFTSKIVYSPSCWFWTGAISTPDGYGRFTWQHDGQQRTMLAHRFALVVGGVSFTDGDVAEHACNEPLCVRVDGHHVHVSTQSDNLRYAVRHGRHDGARTTVQSENRARRSLRIRQALADGWDHAAFLAAITETGPAQPRLF